MKEENLRNELKAINQNLQELWKTLQLLLSYIVPSESEEEEKKIKTIDNKLELGKFNIQFPKDITYIG